MDYQKLKQLGRGTAAVATVVLLLEHIHVSPGTGDAEAGTVLFTLATKDHWKQLAITWQGPATHLHGPLSEAQQLPSPISRVSLGGILIDFSFHKISLWPVPRMTLF